MVLIFFLWGFVAVNAQHLRCSPVAGVMQMRSGRIWVQTTGAAEVKIRYWKQNHPKRYWETPTYLTQRKHLYAAILLLDSLEPGTRYAYQVVVGGHLEPDTPLTFQTPPHWQYRTKVPDFCFAVGSCAFINDSADDRKGPPYGSHYEIFDQIANKRPTFMLWLGDNVYFRPPDWSSYYGMLYRYTQVRCHPALQRLWQSTMHLALWDDHDYGPNNSNGAFVHKSESLEAFRHFWPNPVPPIPDLPGNIGYYQWGDVLIVWLDNRWYRKEQRQCFGEKQIQWLIDVLRHSKATFKIIATGGQILNPLPIFETYANYPEERAYFLEQLKHIEGVFILSGDRHFTELNCLRRPDSYPLYELTVSPLTSKAYHPTEKNPYRVPGTLVSTQNFALLCFYGPLQNRKMKIQVFDWQGKLHWEKVLSAKELQLSTKD